MLTARFNRLVRWPGDRATRRGALGLGLAGLLGAREAGTAAKKRKRKKCKPRCPDCPPPEPTCAGFCAPECAFCFNRPDSAPLCGNGFSTTGCNPCSSDNDCLGTQTPYCATHRTELGSGEHIRWDGPTGSCLPYAVGICISVQICIQP